MLKRTFGGLSLLKDRRGSSVTEFGLIAPVFFLAMFGTIDFGRLMWAYNTIEHATTEGARYAAIRGANKPAPATTDQVKTFVRDRAYALNVTLNDVAVTWTPDNTKGSAVTVQVNFDHTFLMIGFLPLDPVQLRTSSTMIVN